MFVLFFFFNGILVNFKSLSFCAYYITRLFGLMFFIILLFKLYEKNGIFLYFSYFC